MTAGDAFLPLLQRVAGGHALGEGEATCAFAALISGEVPDIRIAAFLTALAARQPTVEEVTGAARAMRSAMRTIKAPIGAIDLCGTGGDGHGTVNVSTAASFVVAACGVPVAKHGNRNMSSHSGAADVLEALGVRVDLEPEAAEACLDEVGLCFLFAPTFHPAMRHVAHVRRQLGFRTVFNLLGPICNPAGVKRQLVGVFSKPWTESIARVLENLGSEHVWAVNGADGLDELTTTDVTHVACFMGTHDVRAPERPADDPGMSSIRTRTINAETYGLPHATLADLRGGTPAENAAAIRNLLGGGRGAVRDIVLLNAAAALVVAEKVVELSDGIKSASEAIDTGAAANVLERLVSATRKFAS